MNSVLNLVSIFNDSQEVTFNTDNGIRKIRDIFLNQSNDSLEQVILIQSENFKTLMKLIYFNVLKEKFGFNSKTL